MLARAINKFLRRQGVFTFRRAMPWGVDMFRDLAQWGNVPQNAVIFDVGANEGQTLVRMKDEFPSASLYCYEPVAETYSKLEETARSFSGVICRKVALSAKTGCAQVIRADFSLMNQIEPCESADESADVVMSTVDSQSQELNIERIHLLKIDTEGHDLEVLKGASKMLKSGCIDFVLTEVGFGDAPRFVLDTETRGYLSSYGYRLLSIYDQTPMIYQLGWEHAGLYFANMLFVRPGLLQRPVDATVAM